MEGPAEAHARFIGQFLSSVANVNRPLYSRQHLAAIAEPFLTLEGLIRQSFLLGKPWDARSIDPHLGMFDVFLIPTHVLVTYARDGTMPIISPADIKDAQTADNDTTHFSYYSEAARALCSFSKEYMFPLPREIRRRTGIPCMVGSLADFRDNFRIFTQGALASLTDWRNMLVTGGAVVASLRGPTPQHNKHYTEAEIMEFFDANSQYAQSGIDIILYGLTAEQAIIKTREIFRDISESSPSKLTFVRKADRISCHMPYPGRTVHVHLLVYTSLAELLAKCDIDCCSCFYDGSTVYMNPRGLVALMRQTNIINLELWSPAYEIRLAKYAKRGFEVHVLFLEREKVAYNRVYDRNLEEFPLGTMSRLLVLELLHQVPDHLLSLNKLFDRALTPLPEGELATCIYAPLDKQLERHVDMYWTHIPRGPMWDDTIIQTLIKTLPTVLTWQDLSQDAAFRKPGLESARGFHRHPAYASNELSECLNSVCESCPTAITEEEKEDEHLNSMMSFINGPLRFNGNSLSSDNTAFPLLLGENETARRASWAEGAYLRTDETSGTNTLQVIPRQFWAKCALGVIMPFAHGSIEGAIRTDLSPQSIGAKLERFLGGEYDSDDSDSISSPDWSDEEYAYSGAEDWSGSDMDVGA